jgi:hypothetical protein
MRERGALQLYSERHREREREQVIQDIGREREGKRERCFAAVFYMPCINCSLANLA